MNKTTLLISIVIGLIIASILFSKNTKNIEKKQKNSEETATATFAGGCFWCMQPPYDHLPGVLETVVGFTGGHTNNPTYKTVTSGKTGHAEAVQITFDPKKITYQKLLSIFWKNINPTTVNQQFADIGTHYRTVIFYHNLEQKKWAEESKKELENSQKFKNPIVTKIEKYTQFYPAEKEHQDFYKKHPLRYKAYKTGSGRSSFIQKNWN